MISILEKIEHLHSGAPCERHVHEMNRLSDISWLPISVFGIVGMNSALAVMATYLVHKAYWESYYMLVCLACVIAANILPIALVRLVSLRAASYYPKINQMRLLADFYKLSDWVYLLFAANVGFWVVISWTFLTYRNSLSVVMLLFALSFLCTLFPWLARLLLSVWNSGVVASKYI